MDARDDAGIDLDSPPSRWHVLTGHVQTLLLQVALISERQQREQFIQAEIKAGITSIGSDVVKLTAGQIRLEGRVDAVESSYQSLISIVKWIGIVVVGAVIAAILRLVIVGGVTP